MSLRLAAKLELRRVVRDDDSPAVCSSSRRLTDVRREDRRRRHLLVAKEPIRCLEFGVVECFRETFRWTLREPLSKKGSASIWSGATEVGIG